jgi:hypothetical protein
MDRCVQYGSEGSVIRSLNRDRLCEVYLQKLEAAGFTRESGRDVPMLVKGGGCGSH